MSNIAWETIEWANVRSRVSRYQRRIYKASLDGNREKVRFLQKKLLTSLDAKLLSVLKVTTLNQGKKTAGVDGRTYRTPEAKMELVKSLKIDGKALPIKRVWIPKPGRSEKRPLGIPVVKDRAKQALCLLALEPEWEARFEPNSYGFRPGRNCHDAIEALFTALANTHKGLNRTKYVLDADLKNCFDRIDHTYLIEKLDTLPEIKTQILAWLKAGIMEGWTSETPLNKFMVPANQIGTPQGGIISPFLANIALHGLETHLKEWVLTKPYPSGYAKSKGKIAKTSALTLVRYADDFVVLHPEKERLVEIKIEIQKWLDSTSKLTFNEEKTKIVSSSEGFDFLGFRIITITKNSQVRCKIYPSKSSKRALLDKTHSVLKRNRSVSSYELIERLRPIILGWGNYYKYCECAATFKALSHDIYQQLRSWVFRRDKRNSRYVVKEKYFPEGRCYTFLGTKHYDNWTLVGEQKDKKGELKSNWLPKLSWIHSKKWVKVRGTASVYDGENAYWANRSSKYGNWNAKERTLLKFQNGKCPYCHERIDGNAICEVDHIIPRSEGGKDHMSNLQLLHKECHQAKTKIWYQRY